MISTLLVIISYIISRYYLHYIHFMVVISILKDPSQRGPRRLNGSQASQGPQHVAQPCIAAQIHEATGDVAPGAAQSVQLGAQVLLGGR